MNVEDTHPTQTNNLKPLKTSSKTPSIKREVTSEILSKDTGFGSLRRVFRADNRSNVRKLDLKRCRNFNDEQMIQFANILKGNLTGLKSLNIAFVESTELKDSGVRTFAKILHGGIPGLTNLAFQVAGSNISNAGALEINDAIKDGYYDVTHLRVDFTGCKNVGHESISKFCNTIRSRLRNVTHLGLHFSECGVGDATLASISRTLKSALTRLKELEIVLIGCRDITDVGLKELGNAFSTHPKKEKPLRVLKIDLTECRGISNDGIGNLFTSLCVGYRNLEELHIEAIDCQNVTDQGVTVCSNALSAGGFGQLKNMTLNFIGCENVTNTGMKELGQVINKMTHLKEYEVYDGSGTIYKNQFNIKA